MKAWMKAVAILILGGMPIGIAVLTAGPQPLTTGEHITYLVGVKSSFIPSIPVAFDHSTEGERLIGTRQTKALDGTPLTSNTTMFSGKYSYPFKASAPVSVGGSNWRLAIVRSTGKYARSWELLADDNPSNVKFYRNYKEYGVECVKHLSVAECVSLLNEINSCWEHRTTGQICHDGWDVTSGNDSGGFDAACTITAANYKPYPCRVWAGEDPDVIADQDFPDISDE